MILKNKKIGLIFIVAFSCIIMGFIDGIIQPNYWIKSLLKIILFLLLPFLYGKIHKDFQLSELFKIKKEGIKRAIFLGFSIYFLILGGFYLTRNIFDFSNVTTTLEKTIGVSKNNFIFVSLYISFVNSLLEEFFFRGFGFLTLKKVSSRKFAYFFSSICFALYHIAMMIGWFSFELISLMIFALIIGGMIFNYANEKFENIYISWLIHMFANFGINTVGFILFSIITLPI